MYCDWPHLDRFCFCLPLRKGVLILGYANIIFCTFIIGFNSYIIHTSDGADERRNFYHQIMSFPAEVVIAMNCIDIIFSAVLIYGAHMKAAAFVKAYYYFALIWTLGMAVMQLIDPLGSGYTSFIIEALVLTFAFVCLQLYLITLVRSLLKNLESSGPHVYENQLHQIVNGDLKVESNGVYNNTTTPANV